MIAECTLNCKVEIRFLIISMYRLTAFFRTMKPEVLRLLYGAGSRQPLAVGAASAGYHRVCHPFAGAIEITADQKAIVVQAGESVRFQGDTTHAYRNISDQTTILHMILYNP